MKMTIRPVLRVARRRLKLSMAEVGRRLDPPISMQMVSKYEWGIADLTPWAEQRLAQIVEILQLEAKKQGIDPELYEAGVLCPDLFG